jgi:hypothetical protein
MKKVEFKFDVDEMVETVFETKGIIEMCAIDDGASNNYYVKCKDSSKWFKESEISST